MTHLNMAMMTLSIMTMVSISWIEKMAGANESIVGAVGTVAVVPSSSV